MSSRFARGASRLVAAAAALACMAAAPAADQVSGDPRPMSYLEGYGARAHPVVPLTWGLLGISVAVIVIVGTLVFAGVVRRRARAGRAIAEVPVERTGNGLRWIWLGVGISCVPLLVTIFWTVQVLGAMGRLEQTAGPLTIEVTGWQWWWSARYMNPEPSHIFSTANEIHIPTGRPVQIRLKSADVIHSFWVPALSGKTDVIPGQINVMWLQADVPGRYRGTCGEFCGAQHAHMGLEIVAEPPDAFLLWEAQQLQPAPPPATQAVAQGQAVFVYRCGACHTVRGTLAGGSVAPDLTHLMSRDTLAAVTLPHNIATLSAWVANPQAIKPGVHMPNMAVTGPELQALRTFLGTLR